MDMTAPLTGDDVGKTVVDVEDKELGIVAKVDGSRAAVDPNPSVAEQVLASVGWEGEDDEGLRRYRGYARAGRQRGRPAR